MEKMLLSATSPKLMWCWWCFSGFSFWSTLKFWDVQTLKWFRESVLERKINDQKMQLFRQPERTWKPLFKVPRTRSWLVWATTFVYLVLLSSVSCSAICPASSQVSLSRIDTSGEYVPLRFSLEHYPSNGNKTRKPAASGMLRPLWFLSVCLSVWLHLCRLVCQLKCLY